MSRLGSIFGHGVEAFLLFVIVSNLSLAIFSILTAPYPSSFENSFFPSYDVPYDTTSAHTQIPYVDFPALMSIESSLERIVGSATSGSPLARLLKQGEMSISDLGTVVKHSDLSCRRSLGERLDRFASDAKEGVIALQLFDSKAGFFLDQLVSTCRYK